MSVLIIEDDEAIAAMLKRGLEAEGYEVKVARDGIVGLASALTRDNELIILDLKLPGAHGLDVCREIRARGNYTPIIMLTALDTLEDKVEGLKVGADDYLTKPFSFDELLARANAHMRRSRDFRPSMNSASAGDLSLDREAICVTRGGAMVQLTPTEFATLELLLAQPGKVFSREAIRKAVWGDEMDPDTNVVDVYIGKLRRKLEEGFGSPLIHTVRGRGYRIINN